MLSTCRSHKNAYNVAVRMHTTHYRHLFSSDPMTATLRRIGVNLQIYKYLSQSLFCTLNLYIKRNKLRFCRNGTASTLISKVYETCAKKKLLILIKCVDRIRVSIKKLHDLNIFLFQKIACGQCGIAMAFSCTNNNHKITLKSCPRVEKEIIGYDWCNIDWAMPRQ